MHDQCKAKLRRLSIWFTINSIIFISCYLNYRLQLKHRYLYKTLSIGLCLSRAAAMVINFNLVLVWIPMCKYTLTRLAVIAVKYSNKQRVVLNNLISLGPVTSHALEQLKIRPVVFPTQEHFQDDGRASNFSRLRTFVERLKLAASHINFRMKHMNCTLKIRAVNSFLIAVDHSTSLHTISATTITLASVVHTVAHLMNVINFSNNFDPLLGNLNMADYKGQNPSQLLVSVPGITGCCMILILILMSLSSIGAIRNSSFDLFQIFHRLSILFVIFLILHPSSHVLKEQSNVDRHHPDICYDEMVNIRDAIFPAPVNLSSSTSSNRTNEPTAASSPAARFRRSLNDSSEHSAVAARQRTHQTSATLLVNGAGNSSTGEVTRAGGNQSAITVRLQPPNVIITSYNISKRDIIDNQEGESKERIRLGSTDVDDNLTIKRISAILQDPESIQYGQLDGDNPCQDIRPKFVAQSSICWYVLGVGLSCYLMDLILRWLRRNKNPVELLDSRSDAEGNLIELTLSNNHKRFALWLPGQFVYLNCPQIATYEWHPFTISSMDNRTRQFTLHIKTGGDWTRKLRDELRLRQRHSHSRQCSGSYSLSLFSRRNFYSIGHCCNLHFKGSNLRDDFDLAHARTQSSTFTREHNRIIKVAHLDGQSHRSSEQRLALDNPERQIGSPPHSADSVKIYLDAGHGDNNPHSLCCCRSCFENRTSQTPALNSHEQTIDSSSYSKLDLYVDGPFHSPFERLLEQQVSVCIANGVGWTAFSSVFQRITDSSHRNSISTDDDWWKKWYNFADSRPKKVNVRSVANLGCGNSVAMSTSKLSKTEQKLSNETNLHLMIIVTTVEQLKPFYSIVMKFFGRMQIISEQEREKVNNPIKEITAYVTRSTKDGADVANFCRQERLDLTRGSKESLMVNDTFTVLFGKPNFESYLEEFSSLYSNKRKISIYCCGSYEVKKTVQKICKSLNELPSSMFNSKPVYCYHEENF